MSGRGPVADYVERRAAVYAGMTPPIEFDPSALWEVVGEIRRAFETGERIAVLVDGEVLTGTVSVTIGWRPAFLLMRTSRALGSSDVLGADAVVLAQSWNGKYYKLWPSSGEKVTIAQLRSEVSA
jgi:hypothetical protein